MKCYLYPARIFNKVDFPAPEGPNIAVKCPDLNCPLIPFNITFLPMTQIDKEKCITSYKFYLKFQ